MQDSATEHDNVTRLAVHGCRQRVFNARGRLQPDATMRSRNEPRRTVRSSKRIKENERIRRLRPLGSHIVSMQQLQASTGAWFATFHLRQEAPPVQHMTDRVQHDP